MILSGPLGIAFRELMFAHRDHEIVIAIYGPADGPIDVAIECLDCNEVLIDSTTEDEGDDVHE